MAREIKFRAWNGATLEYNVMAGWLGTFYVKGIDEKESACMSSLNTNLGTAPVMRFTGLTDKNGKAIYEGDIVRYPEHNVPSAANCLRYAITSDISCSFFRPEKIIFVPGTTLAGARRWFEMVCSSQIKPEPLFADEYL
jgi:hypothetical protein